MSDDANTAYVLTADPPTIAAVDTQRQNNPRTIRLAAPASDLAVTLDEQRIFVADPTAHAVAVLHPSDSAPAVPIDVGAPPSRIAMSPDRGRLYVTLPQANAVAVIDVATQQVVARLPVGHGPQGVAASPDGTAVFVADTSDGAVTVIDPRTDRVVTTVPAGPAPVAVAAVDAAHVVVADRQAPSLTLVNVTDATADRTVPLSCTAGSVVVLAPSRAAYAACRSANLVYGVRLDDQQPRQVPVGPGPVAVAWNGLLHTVYVATTGDRGLTEVHPTGGEIGAL